MNPEALKQLLESLRGTDIEELNLEAGETTLYFKRSDIPAPAPVAVAAAAPAKVEEKVVPVKSPMVGTFYHSDSADHPPFVIEGNHVSPGQKIGIIEAMKIIKNVNSNVKGRIVKVSVKDGQSVEYGQELFLVDTSDIES